MRNRSALAAALSIVTVLLTACGAAPTQSTPPSSTPAASAPAA